MSHSVEEALAHNRRLQTAVLDYRLPDGTGLHVARELRARDPSIQILFISGYADDLQKGTSGNLAGVETLEKPVETARLSPGSRWPWRSPGPSVRLTVESPPSSRRRAGARTGRRRASISASRNECVTSSRNGNRLAATMLISRRMRSLPPGHSVVTMV